MRQEPEYKKCVMLLILYFIFSRIVFYLLGIRFDVSPLSWFYQFLEPVDLKNDLFRSIIYLHIQPPFFNLLLGIVLNLSPKNSHLIFHSIYMSSGLIMVLILCKLLIELNISKVITLIICIFFVSSPPVILYENWLFYEYPSALILLISLYLLHNYLKNKRYLYLFLLFLFLSFQILLRAIFHWLWFIIILLWFIITFREDFKKIILASAIPLVLVFAFYFKNYLIFKQFNLSSWVGMNLIKMTWTIPRDRITELLDNKKISEITLLLPFRNPEEYQKCANFDTTTGITALDRKYKESGIANFNHIAYIKISEEYLRVAKFLIVKYPQYYLLSVAKALYAHFKPCCDSTIIKGNNRKAISKLVNLYEYYLLGGFLVKFWYKIYVNSFNQKDIIHLNLLYIYLPIIYLWGFLLLFKGKSLSIIAKPQKILLSFIMFNILYVTIVGNIAETGENMRFRFLLLPFTYILLGTLIQYLLCRKSKLFSKNISLFKSNKQNY